MHLLTPQETQSVCGSGLSRDEVIKDFIFDAHTDLLPTEMTALISNWPTMVVVMIDVFIEEGNTYSSFTYPLLCTMV